MTEYDELYLIKNPFFLGSFEKAIKEHESIILEETDIEGLEKKTFYLVRSYLALAEYEKAELALKNHIAKVKCKEEEKVKFEKLMEFFIEFAKTGVNYSLTSNRSMMRIL